MKRTSNLFKLLKLSQENNSEAWQAVLTEVTDPSVPSGFGLEGIEESAESAKDLEAKINEVKESPGTFSADDAKDLEEMMKDPDLLKTISDFSNGMDIPGMDTPDQAKAASKIIDILFVKEASKYFSKKESIAILRDINIYQSLFSEPVKIASKKVSLQSSLFQKQFYFEKMCSDWNYLAGSEIKKISSRKESLRLQKEAISLGEAWSGIKNVGKGIGGSVASGIKSTFSGLFKILPFVGLVWGTYNAYNSFKKYQSSEASIKSNFSDLADGDSDQLLNPTFIGSLIDKFRDDPESLLRVAQLNKISKYYKEEFLNFWYSLAWAISDLIASGAIILSGGATAVATGIVSWIARALGFTAIAGPLATGFLDFGIREYSDNSIGIKTIAEINLKFYSSKDEDEPTTLDEMDFNS